MVGYTSYGEELRCVNRFKYLGRLLSYDNSETPSIRHNLKRARAAWGRLSAIIAKEEIPPAVAGMFYQAVVAAVLFYGSESWVISAFDLRALDGFHVEAARRLTGMRPRKRGGTRRSTPSRRTSCGQRASERSGNTSPDAARPSFGRSQTV